jgi:NAD(P)-dependent dehydrogenase (short-subunit alcohol dehydrogenase family)
MDLGLQTCKAFVAGTSKGLDKACAEALGRRRRRIYICSRNTEELEQQRRKSAPPVLLRRTYRGPRR